MGRKQPFRLRSDLSLAAMLLQAGWLAAACKASLKAALRFNKAQLFLCSSFPQKSHLYLGTSPLTGAL